MDLLLTMRVFTYVYIYDGFMAVSVTVRKL